MRQRIHLRLCAAAALVSLPVAATTTNALSGTPVVGALAAGSTGTGSSVFGATVAASMSQLESADPEAVARTVRETSRQELRLASPGGVRIAEAMDDLGIPRPALIAYQVAAATMNQADPDCGIDWSLLAAIGRVETDHGRFAGAQLGDDGVSTPSIRGVALNGVGAVRAVPDTDGGSLDGDRVWDRAVGPMQFLPSTWAYAGVDADGNGTRNPDDLDDAALAAAVYLCAAPGSVADPEGQRTAVHRYNQSQSYVDLVVELAAAYRSGNAVDILPTSPTPMAMQATMTDALYDVGPAPSPDRSKDGDGDRGDGGDTPVRSPDGDGDGDAHIVQPGNPPPDRGTDQPLPPEPTPDTDPGPDPEPTPDVDPEPTPGTEPDPEPTPDTEPEPNTEPTPDTEPEPDTEPTPDPEPEPAPEPPAPAPAGVLALVGGRFHLGAVPLDVGDETWLATTALADFDGDGALESNLAELTGLVGRPVDVAVDTSTGAVLGINGQPYRD